MLTKTELQGILNQINGIFDELRARIEKLEAAIEPSTTENKTSKAKTSKTS